MELGVLLLIMLGIHLALFFIDFILKSCMCLPYLQLLHHLGLTIKPLQVRLHTTMLQRPLAKWLLGNSRLNMMWFTTGVVVTVACLLPSVILLIFNLVRWLVRMSSVQKEEKHVQEQLLLQPMFPGVNLSSEDVPMYLLTLLVSSILHEAGHAVAAIREGVRVEGVGLLLLFVLPGAFVMLPSDSVALLHPFRRLKIVCAGVWHNIMLVLAAVALALLTPMLLTPLYRQGEGAIVTHVTQNSPARGTRGLLQLDVVTNINDCHVTGAAAWHDCLLASLQQSQRGRCIAEDVIYNMDESTQHTSDDSGDSVQCCRASDNSDHLCFALLMASGDDTGGEALPMLPFTCLPARPAIAGSVMSCSDSAQCDPGHFCLAPSLPEGVRLLVITRATPAELPLTQQRHGKRVLTWSQSEKKMKNAPIRANSVSQKVSVTGNEVTTKEKQGSEKSNLNLVAKPDPSTAIRLRRSIAKKLTNNSTKLKNNSLQADHIQIHADRKLSKREYQAVHTKPTSAEKVPVAQSHTKPDDGDDHHTHDSDVPSDFTAVLYLGSPALLYQTVIVSDYVPRFSFVSLGWGEALFKLLDYIIKFSGALALLNLVPCVYLDGEYITEALVEGCLGSVMSRQSRSTLRTTITWCGTALLVANVAVGMLTLL